MHEMVLNASLEIKLYLITFFAIHLANIILLKSSIFFFLKE